MTPTKTRTKTPDRTAIVTELRSMLEPFAGKLHEVRDGLGGYCLETDYVEEHKKPLFFAGVREGKAYVSYYLMPVYVCPDLLAGMSPELKKRMQGKSCFNFRAADPRLFAELKALTKRSFERFKEAGYV